MSDENAIIRELHEAVIQGDAPRAAEAARKGIEGGIKPLSIVEEGLTPAIREVGERFGRMEMFLPEMVVSAEAMEAALSVLAPHFEGMGTTKKGRVLIGTVKGDIHDIGKNIVTSLLKVNGYEVTDLGRDVPSTEFVDKAVDLRAQVICISGLLTTSLPMMRDIVQLMNDDGVRDKFKVIIGGGPTSQDYADQIGADGYGATAYDAVVLCDQLIGHTNSATQSNRS